MTSQGHAYARFRRALAGSSMLVIRSAAADVEHIGLEDGLAISLAFLDLEPETFPRAANRWVARLTLERGLALAESQLAPAAFGALASGAARAGAEALIELCDAHRLERVDALFSAWLERKGLAD
jgi:hypothetical protein